MKDFYPTPILDNFEIHSKAAANAVIMTRQKQLVSEIYFSNIKKALTISQEKEMETSGAAGYQLFYNNLTETHKGAEEFNKNINDLGGPAMAAKTFSYQAAFNRILSETKECLFLAKKLKESENEDNFRSMIANGKFCGIESYDSAKELSNLVTLGLDPAKFLYGNGNDVLQMRAAAAAIHNSETFYETLQKCGFRFYSYYGEGKGYLYNGTTGTLINKTGLWSCGKFEFGGSRNDVKQHINSAEDSSSFAGKAFGLSRKVIRDSFTSLAITKTPEEFHFKTKCDEQTIDKHDLDNIQQGDAIRFNGHLAIVTHVNKSIGEITTIETTRSNSGTEPCMNGSGLRKRNSDNCSDKFSTYKTTQEDSWKETCSLDGLIRQVDEEFEFGCKNGLEEYMFHYEYTGDIVKAY